MRRLIAIIALLATPALATTWYATTASANMSAVTWRDTKGASCAGSGATLTWASRAGGDIFNVNGCASVTIDADPGANGAVTLTNDATNTGGGFLCATANNINITAAITATASGSAVVTTTGSSGTGCNITGNITGGAAASAQGVADTHTVVTITVTGNVTGGSSSSSAQAYLFTAATGSVTVTGNSKAGTVAAGIQNSSSTGGTVTVQGNCVGSDTSGGGAGCIAGNATAAGAMTVNGSLVAGKFAGAATGKIYLSPSTTASAIYFPINSTYVSTNIVDANGAILGSPTLTNAFVAPMAFVSSGIGTLTNVCSPIVYGPYTGTKNCNGGNSGSAH